jgi:hypothetical protein
MTTHPDIPQTSASRLFGAEHPDIEVLLKTADRLDYPETIWRHVALSPNQGMIGRPGKNDRAVLRHRAVATLSDKLLGEVWNELVAYREGFRPGVRPEVAPLNRWLRAETLADPAAFIASRDLYGAYLASPFTIWHTPLSKNIFSRRVVALHNGQVTPGRVRLGGRQVRGLHGLRLRTRADSPSQP